MLQNGLPPSAAATAPNHATPQQALAVLGPRSVVTVG